MAKSKSAPKPETEIAEGVTPAPAPAPSETVAPVTAAQLNAVVETPTPNERTIEAMQQDAAPASSTPAPAPSGTAAPGVAPEPTPGQPDKDGTAFDPSIHDARLNRDGVWARKRGRKKGSVSEPAAPRSIVGTADASPASPGSSPIGDRFDLAAELYTRAGYSVLDGAFSGDGEWLPENDGEHVALRGAVATYLRHKGTDDLPPGLAVGLAIATYGAKRISKPNTSTRLRLYVSWIKAKWQSWRTGTKIDALPRAEIRKEEKSPLPPQNNLPGNSSPHHSPYPPTTE
jgi:hypothetical protein